VAPEDDVAADGRELVGVVDAGRPWRVIPTQRPAARRRQLRHEGTSDTTVTGCPPTARRRRIRTAACFVADDHPSLGDIIVACRKVVVLAMWCRDQLASIPGSREAQLLQPQCMCLRQPLELLVAIGVRQPEIDHAACVLGSVREEREPVVDADPAMPWGVHGDVRLAHATDRGVQNGTRDGKVLVQLVRHLVERLQHPGKEAQLVLVDNAQRPEEVYVLLVGFSGHITQTDVQNLQEKAAWNDEAHTTMVPGQSLVSRAAREHGLARTQTPMAQGASHLAGKPKHGAHAAISLPHGNRRK